MPTVTDRRPLSKPYLAELNRTPLLSAAEEKALARRIAAGDPEARDHLVRANLRLVVNIARAYAGKGLPLEELVAEGNMGLIRAAEGYDADMNTRFSTYASYWVKQAIRRALSSSSRTVRLPVYMTQLVADWRKAEAALRDELGRAPSDAEVGDRLGLTARQRTAARRAMRGQSGGLDAPAADGSPAPASALPDDRAVPPDEALADAEQVRLAVTLVDRLGEREALVVRLRFGLDGSAPLSLREIGDRLGCTRERVRQLETEALAQLRDLVQAA